MTEAVFDIVQRTLIDEGIETYAPGQKKGDCTSPYCVLRDSGAVMINGLSSERHYYTLLCYVPNDSYYELADFVARCKAVMDKPPIYPMLMPTGTETPSFYDDTNDSVMISVRYSNNVRSTHVSTK